MKTLILKKGKDEKACLATQAVKALRQGKIIIYPTSSSYGIGCSAGNEKAIARVYKIKKRNKSKPLLVLVSSLKNIRPYAVLSPAAKKLARHFFPGPLTIVANKTQRVPKILNAKEIAFRIDTHPLAQAICRAYSQPLTSASANLEGKALLYSGKEVIKQFKGKVDLIIDYGELEKNKPSTLVDSRSGQVLRKGPITLKEIRRVLGE